MAVASLAVAFFSQRLDRRRGIILSLALLAIPTLLLAFAPNLAVFAALRIAQGLCMASAFTLTLAYLGERCSTSDTAGAFAAYVTGSVASNLLGRLISAAVAGHFGLASNVREGCATLHSSGPGASPSVPPPRKTHDLPSAPPSATAIAYRTIPQTLFQLHA
jgi:MFS transporter, YNFM family, putative membrane transport protein